MAPGWKYAAASVIGTSHLKTPDGECQDSNSCSWDEKRGLLVCAVSDGAGSAKHSAIASRLTCALAIELVNNAPDDAIGSRDLALDVVSQIRDALKRKAEEMGESVREFACTLLLAAAKDSKVSFWQVGDGAICFRLRDESFYKYAFWPAKGEYANVTEFVTDANVLDEVAFDSFEAELVDLALFSDGLERLALDFKLGEAHSKFFMGLFPHLYQQPPGHLSEIEEKLSTFLASERVNSKTDDDKTLVLATLEFE